MPNENPVPLAPAPGVCFSASPYAMGKDVAYIGSGSSAVRTGAGRWSGASNIEFVAGFPQKIAGWSQAVTTALEGIPRVQKNWRDSGGLARVAIGTTSHLYSWQSGVATDITPATTLSTGSLSGPITTISGSKVVAIADASQVLQNGDWVLLQAASAVGGLTINGWYQVSSRTGSGYNITSAVAATGSAGPLGGTTTFQYPRITLTNPFTTVNGSPVVSVAHTAHGRQVGDYVVFSGASAVGGLTPSGEFPVATVTSPNAYTVVASANASSDVSGGGGSVSITYLLSFGQAPSSSLPVYGSGAYGVGAYGTGGVTPATLGNGWTLDAYGSQMLACPAGGTIYVYDTAGGGRAYPMLNAPATVNAMFVTAERFVVALGVGGNLMQMAWCDQNDYTVWTTLPTNTANSGRTLIGGSYFVGGLSVRNGISLIWTDKCVFTMNYTAGQEVYSTPIIGDNCGLVSPWAMCSEGGAVYWMGDQDWWIWNGSVASLPSDDVRASVFQATTQQAGINRTQLSKCVATLNRAKKQVRFFFPSAAASENDGGMIFAYDSTSWAPLSYGRCSAADSSLLPTPMSCDTSGLLYYDETGVDANGGPLPCSISMAPIDVSNGSTAVDIYGFLPDFEVLAGTVMMTAQATYYSSKPFLVDGPWPITSDTDRQDLLLDGRLFAFEMALNGVGSNMRLGINRLDVQPSGARV